MLRGSHEHLNSSLYPNNYTAAPVSSAYSTSAPVGVLPGCSPVCTNPKLLLQAVHTLEDVGDSELPALAGGEVLRTVKIINKEVRLASKVARTGMDRLREALTTVSSCSQCALLLTVPCGSTQKAG